MNSTPNTPKIDAVYYGPRAAMQAEVGTAGFYEGKFLVQIIGDGEWDAEGVATITEARKVAKHLASHYGVKAVRT